MAEWRQEHGCVVITSNTVFAKRDTFAEASKVAEKLADTRGKKTYVARVQGSWSPRKKRR